MLSWLHLLQQRHQQRQNRQMWWRSQLGDWRQRTLVLGAELNVWLRNIPCQTRGLTDAVDGQTAGVEANGHWALSSLSYIMLPEFGELWSGTETTPNAVCSRPRDLLNFGLKVVIYRERYKIYRDNKDRDIFILEDHGLSNGTNSNDLE